MTKVIRDTRLMFIRSITITLRNPVWLIVGMIQPILYLTLFAPLLDTLKIPGQEGNSLRMFVPGLLVMTALFSVGYAGFNIIEDLRNGVVERLRVTSASRLGLLLGMVLRDAALFIVMSGILVVAAVVMGFRSDVVGLVLIFGMLGLLGLLMASTSYALAMIMKDESALAATLGMINLPLLLLSGVMLPMTLAPKWLQTLADLNPFSYVVDATRALALGELGDDSILIAFAMIGVLTVLAITWSVRTFREANA